MQHFTKKKISIDSMENLSLYKELSNKIIKKKLKTWFHFHSERIISGVSETLIGNYFTK